jgi:hypothetical protein
MEKIHLPRRVSKPRPSGLQRSASEEFLPRDKHLTERQPQSEHITSETLLSPLVSLAETYVRGNRQ